MAGSAPLPKHAPVAVAGALRPGEEAAAIAFAQLDYGEAPQVGLLGDTGTGKTTAAVELVKLYLKKSSGSVFIVDDKGIRSRFEGQERRDRDDLRERPIDWQVGRVTIFRGEPMRAVMVDVEEVAELAWVRAGRARKTLLLVDEMISGREELSKNNQWRSGVTWYPKGFTGGREPGVGNLWGAQSPQLVPVEPFEESSVILCFRLGGMGLAKLKERGYLEGGAGEAIARLHGPPDDPPETRGDFALLRRGRPWDGKIYKFNKGGK
jgi:energy-coupling factor transporter ATP-binding protein EcfA2